MYNEVRFLRATQLFVVCSLCLKIDKYKISGALLNNGTVVTAVFCLFTRDIQHQKPIILWTVVRYIEYGGALLNNDTVVTAASCLFTRDIHHQELLVSLSEWAPYVQPTHTAPTYKNILVTNIHIHPGYNQTTNNILNPTGRDVAILKLSVEVCMASLGCYHLCVRWIYLFILLSLFICFHSGLHL